MTKIPIKYSHLSTKKTTNFAYSSNMSEYTPLKVSMNFTESQRTPFAESREKQPATCSFLAQLMHRFLKRNEKLYTRFQHIGGVYPEYRRSHSENSGSDVAARSTLNPHLPRASTGFLQAARSAGTNEARRPNTYTITTTHTTSEATSR